MWCRQWLEEVWRLENNDYVLQVVVTWWPFIIKKEINFASMGSIRLVELKTQNDRIKCHACKSFCWKSFDVNKLFLIWIINSNISWATIHIFVIFKQSSNLLEKLNEWIA